ncbi:MAG: thiamine pyrophosphate-binding protein [Alphaproteobacteria bacterium]
MASTSKSRTGGQILVDALRIHGANLAFGVPGESYLPILDAFLNVPEIRFIICRQEGGAAMAADAYGKLTGRPGICFVTRGPGATNASAGLHVAHQDSTPMILFIGQVELAMQEREAFQEIDYRKMFGSMAKWVGQIDTAARIPEFVSRAFHVAVSGRPGPVVLVLPEDMLAQQAEVADLPAYRHIEAEPGAEALARLAAELSQSEKPLAILGGAGWTSDAVAEFTAFAEAQQIPVAASFRAQDRLDNRHPLYVGHMGIGPDPKLAARVREADLLLVAGARLGEATTSGYTLPPAPKPPQRFIHVYPDASELGRVYQPDLGIVSGMIGFASAARRLIAMNIAKRQAWAKAARVDYEAFVQPTIIPGDVQYGEIVCNLRAQLPDETIVTNGAGNYAIWVHRFWQYRRYRTQLAPTSGSMGYGLPAAVAAKLVYPDYPVVAFAGDGCFQMTGQEFATAIHYGVPVMVVVVDNGLYGTIRMHQEREFPGRPSGTSLINPDFAALARAYGGHGETVVKTDDFMPAFNRAIASGKPAIIHVKLDSRAVTPGSKP